MGSPLRVLFTEKSCKRQTEELQKTEVYRIEKVIRKTKDTALVRWKGYPDEFNSWVSLKDLTDL